MKELASRSSPALDGSHRGFRRTPGNRLWSRTPSLAGATDGPRARGPEGGNGMRTIIVVLAGLTAFIGATGLVAAYPSVYGPIPGYHVEYSFSPPLDTSTSPAQFAVDASDNVVITA